MIATLGQGRVCMNMNFENDRMISKNALKVVALLAVCGIATFPVISHSNETDNGFDLLPLPSISATYRESVSYTHLTLPTKA